MSGTKKSGRKPLPEYLKEISGTARADRHREEIVERVPGDPIKPKWIADSKDPVIKDASVRFDEKLEIYELRGQPTRGCEEALAQYCVLEAHVKMCWEKGEPASVSIMQLYKGWCGDFNDTPNSQIGRIKKKDSNPFSKNAKKA